MNASARRFAALFAAAVVAGIVALSALADSVQRTTSPVTLFMSTVQVPDAWSALVRTDSGISMTLHTSGLAPGSAATVWWVIFNNPGACVAPCDAPDLSSPAVQASVQYATGHVIGGDGVADYGAYLSEGDTAGCAGFGLPCNGLIDSRAALVHLIVRTHGSVVPGFVDEQISSFNGGCNPGERNVGQCANLQASVHERDTP
jgi:hypothetical protein